MNILSINNLTKRYKKITAVNKLNLEINQGEIYGILGPNGSGKTTTLGMILGVIRPSDGDYKWFNENNLSKNRLKIGAILETPNFYPYMNAADNLKLISHIKKCDNSDNEELLKLVGLSNFPKLPFSNFSLGMKQRLAIAGALVGNPEVLIFDEPTNGLDPQGIAEVRSLLINIGQQGKTILLASHIIDEVEKICSHAAIINKGSLVVAGKVSEIINQSPYFEIQSEDNEQLINVLSGLEFVNKTIVNGAYINVHLENKTASDFNELLHSKGIHLSHLVARNKTLEAEFLDRVKN